MTFNSCRANMPFTGTRLMMDQNILRAFWLRINFVRVQSYLNIHTSGHVVIKLFTTREAPYISLGHHVKLATSMYRRRLIFAVKQWS